MYTATKRTITLPTAYSNGIYTVVGTICKTKTGNTINGSGALNIGICNTADFYCGVRASDGTYGDKCNIITIGY